MDGWTICRDPKLVPKGGVRSVRHDRRRHAADLAGARKSGEPDRRALAINVLGFNQISASPVRIHYFFDRNYQL
jgi:hypothetical protein